MQQGHLEVCTILVHAGKKQELLIKDKAGLSPMQLAFDKGHQQVAHFLVRYFVFMTYYVAYMILASMGIHVERSCFLIS